MPRRFATLLLSVFMLATLTAQGVSAANAAGPVVVDQPAPVVQPIEAAAGTTIIPAEVAEQLVADAVDDCVFCVLTQWAGDGDENVFTIDNSGQVRVDGDIVVNGHHINGATCTPSGPSLVCYRGLHLFRTGGAPGDPTLLSARTISISSGWESGPGTRAHADTLAVPCVAHPDPLAYAINGYPTANVCIGSTPITDPLNQPGSELQPPDAFTTPIPAPGVTPNCPNDARVRVPTGTVASPAKLSINQSTPGGPNFIICPGLYPGGFSLFSGFGTPVHVDMVPGVYFMLGGGFQVGGVASITGNGVMIYNTNANQSYSHPTTPWAGALPPCTGLCQPVTAALTGPSTANIETAGTYTLTLTAPTAPNPTGTVKFYDGDDPLPGCEAQPLTSSGLSRATATCLVTYHAFGRQFITGLYSGDALYAPISDDTFTDVTPSPILGFGGFSICTGAVCSAAAPCANPPVPGGACVILLSAPPLGAPFHGMLLFQERTLGSEGGALGVTLKPGAGLPACTGNWLTDGVPPDTSAIPQPCGPLGGLSGTVYAPHSRSDACPAGGSGCLHDAAVEIRGTGVANLRVIAGRLSLQSAEGARFTYGSALPNLTGLSPAQVWIGVKNSDDVGTNFDLLAEVFENNVSIASQELDNVPGGGSGFNRAINRSIALALAAPRIYGPADKLSIKLSVRVAATGHRSGTARLWFNDAAANSLFDATIDGIDTNFYLRDGFVLGTSPALVTSTSKKSIDVFVDRLVGNNPWKTFGIWTQ